mmetsp:Transcript_6651/g.6505  ORF Transcript_6651/g.6505 Transcript_6651/m.6505 type:complete len:318 (+) Transcript_6651:144-1097(+)
MKHLIEVLINDNLNLQDQLAMRDEGKTPTSVASNSEDEFQRGTANFSVATTYNNSYSKQPTFPQVYRPIAREELKMRRFNNISTYQKGNAFNINEEIKNNASNLYQNKIIKITEEINEEKHRKNMLIQLFRLSPKKMQFVTGCSKVLGLLSVYKKKSQEIMAENSGLTTQLQIVQAAKNAGNNSESEVKDYSILSYHEGEENSFYQREKEDSDRQILNSLREAFESGNTKKFREFAYGLMGEYEASEITTILVKHAKYLEEKICYDFMKLAARRKDMVHRQQLMYENIICQREATQGKIEKLKKDIERHNNQCKCKN